MKDAKEVREAKSKLITQKRMIETLTQDEGFILLMESLQRLVDSKKEEIYQAETWEQFIEHKAHYDGLMALSREVDTIISRGKRAELTSK